MKMSFRFLALFLLTLALSGCATNQGKKSAESTGPVAPQAVAAPAAPAVVQESVPAAPAQPVEEKIPAAVRK